MSFLQKLCEMFMEDSRLEARIPELLNNTLLCEEFLRERDLF